MKKGMSNSRAQTTIFIVIAVIIIVTAVAIFLARNTETSTNISSILAKLEVRTEASQVESSILDCIEQTSQDALTVIGIQGGYYEKPERSFDLEWTFIPYYYDEGDLLMPTQETIEKEIASYVDDNLHFCIEELDYDEFDVSFKDSKTSVHIEEREVSFETMLASSFEKSELSSDFDITHSVHIESALSDILDVARYITDSHQEDPDMFCISCVADMAEEKNLYVDMLDFGEETTTLVVISENYTSSESYVFEFLNRYPKL
ncbi:MAG: hypothetical protein RL557_518 [archaeon]|jgi:hypothetical protein